MVTEDYVSFEIAKLLREKGFNETVRCFYDIRTEILCDDCVKTKNSYTESIAAPTLQMAMKWLRKVHKIHIQVWILEENGYWFDIEKILNAQYKHKSLYSTGLEDIYFDTYEQACEAAIRYCLENLI